MAKSILQDKASGVCYLCGMLLGIDAPAACREEHHVIYGTAGRRLSERYGLKVYLCPYHHRTGPEAVHRCRRTDMALKQAAQRAFEKKYGRGKWMEVFGRNYLEAQEPDFFRIPAAAGREPTAALWESSQTAAGSGESLRTAAGREPAATCKNQQNRPSGQINLPQNTPPGICFLEQLREGP